MIGIHWVGWGPCIGKWPSRAAAKLNPEGSGPFYNLKG